MSKTAPYHHRRGDLGVFGALRLVEQLAGAGEAQRVGQELAYPGWSLHGPTEIPEQRWTPGDLAYLLALAFPWRRPTVGVGLVEGVGELEIAAPFEVYASPSRPAPSRSPPRPPSPPDTGCAWSRPGQRRRPRVDRLVVPGADSAEEVDSQLLGGAADRGLKVEFPNGGQAAGRFSFDAMLADLAGYSDQTTAQVTAKSIEYPTEQLELAGAGWPWRPTALFALTATAALGVALLPAAATRRNRRDAPTNTQPTGGAVAAGTHAVGVSSASSRPRRRSACGGWTRRPSMRCRWP